MNTVFARLEPTDNPATLDFHKQIAIYCNLTTHTPSKEFLAYKEQQDIVFYRDRRCKKFYAKIPWFLKKPTRRNKKVILNCVVWDLHWLPPK